MNREKALEKLATSEKTTIVIERQPDGKMRATSGSWDGEKVILKGQVLELRNVEAGCMSPARSAGRTVDSPIPVYDPYGPGDSHDFDVITVSADVIT